MTQAEFASWLGVKPRTVIAWENDQNPISELAAKRIRESENTPTLNPRMSLEEFTRAQEKAKAQGKTLEEWIASLIKDAIKLIIFLSLVAKLMSGPTDWSGEALAASVGQGCSWFGTAVGYVLGSAWELGGALLAAI